MKYFIKLFSLVFFMFLIFCGCSRKEQVNVGLLMHALDKERWENDRDFFVEKVQELGGTVEVRIADNNAEKQLKQADELLTNNVDILVVVPVDQFAAAQIVEDAHAKNVKVISYDRLIKNCSLDFYVSTDNVEIGKLQAEYLTTIRPTGRYALIGGAMTDNNSQFLYLGQMNVLQPLVERGDVQIIYNVFTESWEEEEGYNHARKLLAETDQVDAIIAGNDAIAYGVIRALREAGKEDEVLVVGMDADLKNLQEIVAGHQTCTIYKPIEKMAATAAELAITLGREEPYEKTFQTVSNGARLVPAVLHNGMVVNRENLKLTVISEGYQSAEDIYR
ncbi:sugar ABC transporter substrate-binding protein [Mariniphaga sediminis]|jgi:D-xylose transport system substrate-binding protein|uniref:Sugar ABC transporter substrate-binding protein n=1 Tax=Mariniphaga sediminis TaxID=1628158 RepID=A0A399CWJ8_9BACT|nr:substrate-binding domain-containing protein [Mariniphaga sediminis]RIH63593.1 sugar ABC transporter substrate-binding protein [Mariniphaga sediminis]